MNINIGSKSIPKVEALKEAISTYPEYKSAKIIPLSVDSGVSEQPKSFDELITGAKNRAKAAYKECDLSFGLESGITKMPHTKTGFMDFCCCAIYDGKDYHLGMSCGLEFPKRVMELVIKEDMNISEAFHFANLTENTYLGNTEGGAIGVLTRDRITRKDYSKQSIITAMIHLENKELY